ncbi:MAG: helix-turn-helix transcriptional regulator [Nitrososphaerales archaeon]
MKNRIKEFRARYDLTQEDLARMVGVRRETIVFLEKGRYTPSLTLAHDVAVALKTTLDELFIFDASGRDGPVESRARAANPSDERTPPSRGES